jgi:hypothetical protein
MSGPPTPRSTVAAQCDVTVICRHCDRHVPLDLAALMAGPHADTPLLELPLQCASCGRMGHQVIVSGYRPPAAVESM